MRFLQIGLGSMGKRRIRCLQANGQTDIVAVDPREDRRAEASSTYGVRTVATFEEGLEAHPDAAIVSVPGAYHMEYMLKAARANLDIFVEVPLATSHERLEELEELVRSQNLLLAPGCQLLFHPPTQQLKSWVNHESFGRLLHVSYTMGTYLPDWHAYEGIEDFYASDIQLGGGNIDVIAQELIWLLWITGGTPQSVTAREGTAGSLPLAPGTPDFIEMILELDEVTMNLHFDINDRTHETYLRMSGEDQTAVWSKVAFGALRLFDASAGSWRNAEPYTPENPEAHYVDEIGAWIACLQNRREWPVSLEMAGAVIRVLEGMRLSSHEGSCVRIAGH